MIFEETQRMSKFWWVLLPLPIVLFVIFAVAFEDENSAERNELLLSIGILFVVELIIGILFYLTRLNTRIDSHGVSFRFSPFLKEKRYTWSEIEKAWVRRYKPIIEYGGWGIKGNLRRDSRAYNVWGNKGLQLHLANGKKVLVGTQKPKEMAAFLNRLKEKHQVEPIQKEELDG